MSVFMAWKDMHVHIHITELYICWFVGCRLIPINIYNMSLGCSKTQQKHAKIFATPRCTYMISGLWFRNSGKHTKNPPKTVSYYYLLKPLLKSAWKKKHETQLVAGSTTFFWAKSEHFRPLPAKQWRAVLTHHPVPFGHRERFQGPIFVTIFPPFLVTCGSPWAGRPPRHLTAFQHWSSAWWPPPCNDFLCSKGALEERRWKKPIEPRKKKNSKIFHEILMAKNRDTKNIGVWQNPHIIG